jgi:hypothetical protein
LFPTKRIAHIYWPIENTSNIEFVSLFWA